MTYTPTPRESELLWKAFDLQPEPPIAAIRILAQKIKIPSATIDGWFDETRQTIAMLTSEGILSSSTFGKSRNKSKSTPNGSMYSKHRVTRVLHRLVDTARPKHAAPTGSESFPIDFTQEFLPTTDAPVSSDDDEMEEGEIADEEEDGELEAWARPYFTQTPALTPSSSFSSSEGSSSSLASSASSSSSLSSTSSSPASSPSPYFGKAGPLPAIRGASSNDALKDDVVPGSKIKALRWRSTSPPPRDLGEPDWKTKRVMPTEFAGWIISNMQAISEGNVSDGESESDSGESAKQ